MSDPLFFKKLNSNQAGLWKAKSPILSKLDMELTERCNNNCVHCFINQHINDEAAKKRELSTDKIKLILTEAASLGCLTVRFTGGEPLLREDFEDLYVFARKLGLKVTIFTNATLVSPQIAELFAKIPPLEKIEVSLYGMSKNSYEKASRIPGSFEAAWNGISLLREKEIPFTVKSPILPSNKEEIDSFITWATCIPWMENKPSFSMFFNLRCRRDSESKSRLIKSIRLSPDEALRYLLRIHPEFSVDMKMYCSQFMYPTADRLFTCGAGVGSGCVDANGYFHPCLMLKNPDTSQNLKSVSMEECLTNYFPKVRELKAENPDYLARCARCFLKGLCDQCPAKSWMEYGTLDTPVEYLCKIAHVMGKHLGLLNGDETGWDVSHWRTRVTRLCRRAPVNPEIQKEKTGVPGI